MTKLISIIMPTYNSDNTIVESLESIVRQTIGKDRIEILIVDGGSTDRTLDIAEQYGARVLRNERKLPEFAKQIGILEAEGIYGIFLDSDEAFQDETSLERRISFLERHKDVKNLVSTGMLCYENETGINRYANYMGDPFSNFIYSYNGYNRVLDMTKHYRSTEDASGYIFEIPQNGIIPLYDALGNMFELQFARELYAMLGEDEKKSFAANILAYMVKQTHKIAMLKNDYVFHRPGLTSKVYFKKLKWRVKNNLFQSEGVGYSARQKKCQKLLHRQFLFALYSFLLVPVLIHSIILSVKNKDAYFGLHFVYTEYVFWNIVWFCGMKALKIPVQMDKTYGKEEDK